MTILHHFFSLALLLALTGCATDRAEISQIPPPPAYAPDHRYSLDELVNLSLHHNASLDVSRYTALAAQGLVDQVKSLWLPQVRLDFAGLIFQNDMSYEARAFHLVSLDIPITGNYNFVNNLTAAQILSTGGKRTSILKQAKMLAAILKLDVLRQQDLVANQVASLYHLVALTNDVDIILEDAIRRLRVFQQVSANLNARGSLRGNNLDTLQARYVTSTLTQLRIAIQAARQQAYSALKQAVGIPRDQALILRDLNLPLPITGRDLLSAYAAVVRGFAARPELQEVDLLKHIHAEGVKFAKAAWAPNIAFLGAGADIQGNNHTILGAVRGFVATLVVDIPIYSPGRRAQLRQALALEKAAEAFQRQIEELITLQIEVTAIDCQRALATLFKALDASRITAEHYAATRQAYSRELVPASNVITALALDMLGKIQYRSALFAYHQSRACLKNVTADRETPYGY